MQGRDHSEPSFRLEGFAYCPSARETTTVRNRHAVKRPPWSHRSFASPSHLVHPTIRIKTGSDRGAHSLQYPCSDRFKWIHTGVIRVRSRVLRSSLGLGELACWLDRDFIDARSHPFLSATTSYCHYSSIQTSRLRPDVLTSEQHGLPFVGSGKSILSAKKYRARRIFHPNESRVFCHRPAMAARRRHLPEQDGPLHRDLVVSFRLRCMQAQGDKSLYL